MSDPLRWSDPESEATTLERVLIQGEATSGPSEQVVSGVWTKLSATLPVSGVAAGAGGAALGGASASAKAVQAGAAAKTVASGSAGVGLAALAKPLILGIALGGGSVVVSHGVKQATAEKPPVVAPSESVRQEPQGKAEQKPPARSGTLEAAERPPEAPPTKPRGSAATGGATAVPEPSPTEPQSRASQLAAERKHLVEARALLRAGRAAECLALLDSNAGIGLLGQERLVIRVDALIMLGRKAEAQALAQALITRHPESPYASYLARVTR
ncbi:MAG: hypothetical protein AB7K71_28075 [Polyangiaceae bacterium]